MSGPLSSPYLELLKKMLIDFRNINSYESYSLEKLNPSWKISLLKPIDKILRTRNFGLFKIRKVEKEKRLNGYDWPANAETMIGLNRLNNIEFCARKIKEDHVEGDFMEAGVWRGGAGILMRALLNELELADKQLWLADSFEGLPEPDLVRFKEDESSTLHEKPILSASLNEVKENFRNYDLLDDKVNFIKGWFRETLPNTQIEKLSLLRIDADLYESTHLVLTHLYPKLSSGGFLIVDDYHAFDFCKKAVDDYRQAHAIDDEIILIDREAIFWRKSFQNN